jgi:hypothetical protein
VNCGVESWFKIHERVNCCVHFILSRLIAAIYDLLYKYKINLIEELYTHAQKTEIDLT